MLPKKLFLLLLLVSTASWATPQDEENTPIAPPSATTPARSLTQLTGQFAGQLSQAKETAGEKANDIVLQAMGLLGIPYKHGGTKVETGFDCSGFVRYMYEKSVGRLLPRRADDQARATEKIDRTELKPGDLVFFNTMKRAFSHVGIYVGDGKFIHSPSTGKSIQVDDMRAAYWQKRFTGARRVQSSSSAETPATPPGH